MKAPHCPQTHTPYTTHTLLPLPYHSPPLPLGFPMHMASFTNLGSTVATAAPALHQSGSSQGQIMSPVEVEDMKAKIMSHPRYSALLAAYLDCQKVGAPPGLLDRLLAVAARLDAYPGQARRRHDLPRDPELDQFMDAYCNMLVRYREELTRPIQEAMEFVKSVERQLNSITVNLRCEGVGSSEDAQDPSGGCGGDVNPTAEDTDQLKHQLLKKYGGCLSGIRQEFSKRKKKGKLPKEARQKLLSWWEQHYKWPYPSETEKMALAEATGLDPKQINNWFINQRKRHWKPSENAADAVTLYMDGQYVVDGVAYRVRP